MKIRNDNKGFTLIEVIIAVMILAIIVVPLLSLFIQSAKMNTTSRRRMNATSIAEDLMEGIKLHDVADITRQFDYPDYFKLANLPGEGYSMKQLKRTGAGQYEEIAVGDAGSVKSDDGGKTYELIKENEAGNEYYYCIKNIVPTGEAYDALIKVDATPYAEGGSAAVLYNDIDIIDPASVSGVKNGSYLQSQSKDDDVLAVLQAKGLKQSKEYPIIDENNLYRRIILTIDKDGEKITALLKYEYTSKVSKMADVTTEEEICIYDNAKTGAELENIFLFYCPLYISGISHDRIEIVNENNVPFNAYIIKQETMPSQSLQAAEATYKVTVAVKEKGIKEKPDTRIMTNINKNLASRYLPSLPEEVNQGTFLYNGVGGSSVYDKLVKTPGSAGKQDKYFDVTVTMYKSEDVTGYAFPDDNEKKIYEITGSTQE